jgi:hypothetical protein
LKSSTKATAFRGIILEPTMQIVARTTKVLIHLGCGLSGNRQLTASNLSNKEAHDRLQPQLDADCTISTQ